MGRKKRRGFGSWGRRLADMSLPPEERGRRRRGKRVGGTPPAQMSHACGAKGRKRQREGEKKMERSR
jgi:hypothetical protein